MTKNIAPIRICVLLILAVSRLNGMEQLSGAVERFKGYSPYLAVPALNIAQYKYRQTIPIEDRYLPTIPAYLAPTAASTIASILLNRNLGWGNAFVWSLFKNIPAWLTTAGCIYHENINDNIFNKNQKPERTTIDARQKSLYNRNPSAKEASSNKRIDGPQEIKEPFNLGEVLPEMQKLATSSLATKEAQHEALKMIRELGILANRVYSSLSRIEIESQILTIDSNYPLLTTKIKAHIDSLPSHYEQHIAPQILTEDFLTNSVSALSIVINNIDTNIPSLISTLYTADILKNQVNTSNNLSKTKKELLSNDIEEQKEKIIDLLYQTAKKDLRYSFDDLFMLTKFVSHYLIKNIFNDAKDLIQNTWLRMVLTSITDHTISSIENQKKINPQKGAMLINMQEFLRKLHVTLRQKIAQSQEPNNK